MFNSHAGFKLENWKMGSIDLKEKSDRGGVNAKEKPLVGKEAFVSANDDMRRTLLSRCKNIQSLPSQVLTCKVTDLRTDTLYKSKVINGVLYDSLVKSHDLKMLYLFQVTDQTPLAHTIKPAVCAGRSEYDDSDGGSRLQDHLRFGAPYSIGKCVHGYRKCTVLAGI